MSSREAKALTRSRSTKSKVISSYIRPAVNQEASTSRGGQRGSNREVKRKVSSSSSVVISSPSKKARIGGGEKSKAHHDDKEDRYKKRVRELELQKTTLEEKLEAKRRQASEIRTKMSSLKVELKDAREESNRLRKEKLKACRESRRHEEERTETKVKIEGLKKKIERLELDRAKAESISTPNNEGFFQDILANFKDLVENQLQCSVCSEMLCLATTITCGHSFCDFCIEQWKQKKNNCPICRAAIRNQSPNLVLDDYIEKAVEQFFPDEGKRQRKELMDERREKRSGRTSVDTALSTGSILRRVREMADSSETDSSSATLSPPIRRRGGSWRDAVLSDSDDDSSAMGDTTFDHDDEIIRPVARDYNSSTDSDDFSFSPPRDALSSRSSLSSLTDLSVSDSSSSSSDTDSE